MSIEQQFDFRLRETRRGAMPVRHVVDGCFLDMHGNVLLRHTSPDAEFSPNKVDLPSLELDRFGSARYMRHAIVSYMRMHGFVHLECDDTPYRADRTITPSNGHYRDTRRIFYSGTILEQQELPAGFLWAGSHDVSQFTKENAWRRDSVREAVLARSSPHTNEIAVSQHTDGAIMTEVYEHTNRFPWGLPELQADLASHAELETLQEHLIHHK